MAVCPQCEAAVSMNQATCANCGASLEITPETPTENLDALREDIADYIDETAPDNSELAHQQVENWRPADDRPAEIVTSEEEAEPVLVYIANDETSARLVASLLETEGLDVMVQQHTVPGLDTAQQMLEGLWGQVYVHRMDEGRARDLLAAYETAPMDASADDSVPVTDDSDPDALAPPTV